jgi:DNA mismatch repair protein MLH1
VDWNSEQECFDTFLRELARFYVPEPAPAPRRSSAAPIPRTTLAAGPTVASVPPPPVDVAPVPDTDARREELAAIVEGIFFPAFRKRLIPTNALLGSVTEIANLKGLYKIFERSC